MRAVLLALVGLASCGGGRLLSGPAVAAAGVVVEPEMARLLRGVLEVRLELDNQTEGEVRVEPHHITLVGPDGAVYPEAGEPRFHRLAADEHDRIRVRFAALDWKLEHAPGFYVRLDGFTLNGEPLPMPALALGHPVTDAEGKLRVRRLVTAAVPARPTEAKPETTCALLPLGDAAITAAVRARLEAAGWTVVTIEKVLTESARLEAAGCRTGECIRELGGAFGVPFLVGGSVAEIEGERALTLRLMAVAEGTATARANALFSSADEGNAAIDAAVQTLVGMD